MKWLRLATFTSMLLFITACASTSAHAPSVSTRLPQSEFRNIVVAPVASSLVSTPTPEKPSPTLAPDPTASPRASSRAATTGTSKRSVTGEASWGPFKGHVVTRYSRGTIVRVCGGLGCTGKVRSWGYGPAKSTGRVADLDSSIFRHVCGPLSMGVCQVKLEVWK
jgi:hypothetical protein